MYTQEMMDNTIQFLLDVQDIAHLAGLNDAGFEMEKDVTPRSVTAYILTTTESDCSRLLNHIYDEFEGPIYTVSYTNENDYVPSGNGYYWCIVITKLHNPPPFKKLL